MCGDRWMDVQPACMRMCGGVCRGWDGDRASEHTALLSRTVPHRLDPGFEAECEEVEGEGRGELAGEAGVEGHGPRGGLLLGADLHHVGNPQL